MAEMHKVVTLAGSTTAGPRLAFEHAFDGKGGHGHRHEEAAGTFTGAGRIDGFTKSLLFDVGREVTQQHAGQFDVTVGYGRAGRNRCPPASPPIGVMTDRGFADDPLPAFVFRDLAGEAFLENRVLMRLIPGDDAVSGAVRA